MVVSFLNIIDRAQDPRFFPDCNIPLIHLKDCEFHRGPVLQTTGSWPWHSLALNREPVVVSEPYSPSVNNLAADRSVIGTGQLCSWYSKNIVGLTNGKVT